MWPQSVDRTMLAKLKTFSLLGIDALPVEVEVDVSPAGLPKTLLVGLPEAAVSCLVEMPETTSQDHSVLGRVGFFNRAPRERPRFTMSSHVKRRSGEFAQRWCHSSCRF